nr:hypothetical protein Iba_chr14cCG6610 [Ipomoea batatas]
MVAAHATILRPATAIPVSTRRLPITARPTSQHPKCPPRLRGVTSPQSTRNSTACSHNGDRRQHTPSRQRSPPESGWECVMKVVDPWTGLSLVTRGTPRAVVHVRAERATEGATGAVIVYPGVF